MPFDRIVSPELRPGFTALAPPRAGHFYRVIKQKSKCIPALATTVTAAFLCFRQALHDDGLLQFMGNYAFDRLLTAAIAASRQKKNYGSSSIGKLQGGPLFTYSDLA